MKKTLLALLIFFPLITKAQFTAIVSGPNISPAAQYVFVGSLSFPSGDYGNSQKLQVEVIGGGWGASEKGMTTFYIANRGGLSVNQVTMGGNTLNGSYLKAYQDGNNTNFYLAVNGAGEYNSIAVRSFLFGYMTTAQTVVNTIYTDTPSGTDISSTLNIKPVLITDADGNIGVNTALPDAAYKLSVNGKIRAKEIKVETGWSDYVFYKSYQLRPLSEVATYIKNYQHLPDVPSAEDVKQNGINVGETNALLLKKIEELTLYLIEKDKQVTEQNKGLADQHQQLEEQKAINKSIQERLYRLEKSQGSYPKKNKATNLTH